MTRTAPDDVFSRAHQAAGWLNERGVPAHVDVCVVLGSGLGAFADALSDRLVLPYDDIPHWPTSRLVGHAGQLISGTMHGRPVIALAGRAHLYEGHPMSSVTFPVRVLGALAVPQLVLTNAAGGINTGFAEGALMVIDDHLNLTGTNPLIGPNDDRLGPRFPDMTEVYSARLRTLAFYAARELDIPLTRGIYLAVHGPSYETPAEIRAFRAMGADAVGMSTVPEAIVARHMGMEVLGVSCITNMAAGVLDKPLRHDEVLETTARVRVAFAALLGGVIARL